MTYNLQAMNDILANEFRESIIRERKRSSAWTIVLMIVSSFIFSILTNIAMGRRVGICAIVVFVLLLISTLISRQKYFKKLSERNGQKIQYMILENLKNREIRCTSVEGVEVIYVISGSMRKLRRKYQKVGLIYIPAMKQIFMVTQSLALLETGMGGESPNY